MAFQIVVLCLIIIGQLMVVRRGAATQINGQAARQQVPAGGANPPPLQPPQPPQPQPPPTIPAPLGGLVDVDVHDTDRGKHVGVHVPMFYRMDLDKEDFGRTGLGINVLEGLVKVRVKKDPFRFKNNVFVSLADIPLWFSRR